MADLNKSPRPWTVERGHDGDPVAVLDAEGNIVCDNETYYPKAVLGEDMADIVDAVNLHEEWMTMVKRLLYGRQMVMDGHWQGQVAYSQRVWEQLKKLSEE